MPVPATRALRLVDICWKVEAPVALIFTLTNLEFLATRAAPATTGNAELCWLIGQTGIRSGDLDGNLPGGERRQRRRGYHAMTRRQIHSDFGRKLAGTVGGARDSTAEMPTRRS